MPMVFKKTKYTIEVFRGEHDGFAVLTREFAVRIVHGEHIVFSKSITTRNHALVQIPLADIAIAKNRPFWFFRVQLLAKLRSTGDNGPAVKPLSSVLG